MNHLNENIGNNHGNNRPPYNLEFQITSANYNNAGTKSKDLPTHLIYSNQNFQVETIKVFTLMIPDIATSCQKVKISSTLKICDMSDISEKSIWFVVND